MTPEERLIIRTATCVHEAGHVVANLKLGLTFLKVEITGDASGYVRPDNTDEGDPFDEAVSFASGYEAEVYWLRKMGHPEYMIDSAYDNSGLDRVEASCYAKKAGVRMGTIHSRANALVASSWAPTLRMAQTLLRSPTMSYSRTKGVARV